MYYSYVFEFSNTVICVKITSNSVYNIIYRVAELLDYSCDDLTGASLYGLCHVEDVHIIRKTHEDRKMMLIKYFYTVFVL